MRLFKVTDDLDEAIAEITGFYRALPLVALRRRNRS